MPTTKKRINLTVSDVLYEELLQYKEEHGITSDASACIQLMTLQLRSAKTGKVLERLLLNTPDEELARLSADGNLWLKEMLTLRGRT